ncbi:septum formation initiator family protein [Candidatus Peregrinibacteria bacterium]|nr:septum formation initiator family protein [Candidatus Peregrinibacteria bacterium]
MLKTKSFSFQLAILGMFIVFFYMFFALAMSIYRDWKLESQIERFEGQIDELAHLARQKPEDVKYFNSEEYKDRYAKENLNLLNSGERLIIIPQEELVIKKAEPFIMSAIPSDILATGNPRQWWAYFFGQTLSVKAPQEKMESLMPKPIGDENSEDEFFGPAEEEAPNENLRQEG